MRKLLLIGLAALVLPLIQPGYAAEFSISPKIPRQGSCFSLFVSSEGLTKVTVDFLGQKISCFNDNDNFKGIIGIPPEQKAGVYPISIQLVGQNDNIETINSKIKIAKTKFPIVSYWLKPAKKKLFTRDLIGEEWAVIEKVLVVEAPERRWDSRFALPVTGPVSMVFGTQEFINNKKSGLHRGYDLAVPTGTKVKAPNKGTVVFAKKLQAFGGTIVIDHGQGIHSLYFHLSKFLANVGDAVNKGDVIALSGNTGISSGSHLHWGLSVHNLRVDPMQWTRYAF